MTRAAGGPRAFAFFFLVLMFAVCPTALACGDDNEPKGGPEGKRPSVEFTVDKPEINLGQASILSWAIQNSDRIEIYIEGGPGEPVQTSKERRGSTVVRPENTTTYVIFAYGKEGIVQRSLTVSVQLSSPAPTPVPTMRPSSTPTPTPTPRPSVTPNPTPSPTPPPTLNP